MEVKLENPILDSVTNKFMVAKAKLEIDYNGEFILKVKVEWYDNVNDTLGNKMNTVIAAMNIPDDRKRILREQFKDTEFIYNTQGKKVDPSTGLQVYADEQTGEFPNEGEIDEAVYLRNIPNQIEGNTTVWEDIKYMMITNMERIIVKNLGVIL